MTSKKKKTFDGYILTESGVAQTPKVKGEPATFGIGQDLRKGVPLDPSTFITPERALSLYLQEVGPHLTLKRNVTNLTFDPRIYEVVRQLATRMGWTTHKTVNALLALVLEEHEIPIAEMQNEGKGEKND